MNSAILFYSTNHAIWAEDELRTAGLNCKMISVPRNLSSDCGYCVKINSGDKEIAENVLKENNIEFSRIEDIN